MAAEIEMHRVEDAQGLKMPEKLMRSQAAGGVNLD